MILLKYPLHLLSEAVIAKLYPFGNMNHVYVVLDDTVWCRETCQDSQFFLTAGLQSLQSRKKFLGKIVYFLPRTSSRLGSSEYKLEKTATHFAGSHS